MRIFGIGTDIIKTSRIKKIIKKKLFLKRLFNELEITKCSNTKNYINCYAKRFAAKEAFSKSIGTGFRNNLKFKDVEILNDKYYALDYTTGYIGLDFRICLSRPCKVAS